MKSRVLLLVLVMSLSGCRTVTRMAKPPMTFAECVDERQDHIEVCLAKHPDPKNAEQGECLKAAHYALEACAKDLHSSP